MHYLKKRHPILVSLLFSTICKLKSPFIYFILRHSSYAPCIHMHEYNVEMYCMEAKKIVALNLLTLKCLVQFPVTNFN